MEDHHAESLACELYDRSVTILDLDAAQVEAFVSGMFAAWETDDEARSFIRLCADRPSPHSALILAALTHLDDRTIATEASSALDSMTSYMPDVASQFGSASPLQGWEVVAPFGRSLVIGFGTASEGVDHAVLAEVDNGVLVDLHLAGAPEELLDTEGFGGREVTVTDIEVGDAMAQIATAWRQGHGTVVPTPGMLANQRFVRVRLGTAADLPLFADNVESIDLSRGMSTAEITAADEAALSTLRGALGVSRDDSIEQAWVEVVHASVPGVTGRERDALLWLEWADWLGVGIGLSRGLDRGERLSGALFVDLVNGCPEVSSTIHRDDRDYAEWAFEVALEHIDDAGLLDEGCLNDRGRIALHPSLVAAWTARRA